MIIGITGAICSGKQAFAEYLKEKYGFEVVNLLELFRELLKERKIKVSKENSPFRTRRVQGGDEPL
jgi:dephospho-CoA kinase